MARTDLRAAQHDVPDTVGAVEECYRRGWTDGLPVAPPTAVKVAAMLRLRGFGRAGG